MIRKMFPKDTNESLKAIEELVELYLILIIKNYGLKYY